MSDFKKYAKSPFLFIFLIFFFLVAVARLLVSPQLLQLDDHFKYDANIISLDNFFDYSNNKFLGEKRSVTSFGYLVNKKDAKKVEIDNFFDVRTVTGEKIIKIERDYSIDPISWTHLPESEGGRSGYLFAPRHLKKGESFTYWHVNYNQPLELVFEEEEVIDGLKTYRYGASFGDDQTQSLTHLPGVPDKRGVNLDVSIQLWIEPVSGWLVKYEDQAIAYYYDQATKKRIEPWNKFSNRYRKNSISRQVEMARSIKLKIWMIEIFIPLLILTILLAIIFFRRQERKKAILITLGSLTLLIIFYFTASLDIFSEPVEPIKIGISKWVPDGNKIYDENIEGFKQAIQNAGYTSKEIHYLQYTANSDSEKQKDVIQSLLEEGVGIIYSLTTSGTLMIKQLIPNLPVVFSIVTYPEEAGLIDSVKASRNNLVGTRNWVAASDQLSVFLEILPKTRSIAFLHRKGELNSDIQLNEMREAAQFQGLEIVEVSAENIDDLSQKLALMPKVDGLYSACDTLIQGEAEQMVVSYALEYKIPSFSCSSSGVEKGDLIAMAADFYSIGQLAGKKAALILEGATPNSLETQTAIRPFIYVNLKTAQHLGVSIPQNILAQAKKIIR